MRSKVNSIVGPQEPLPATVKRRKLARFGHVTRHDSLSKTILSGHLGEWATLWSAEEMMDGQHQSVGIPAPMPELLTMASCRKRLEENLSAESSLMSPPKTQLIKGLD